jgi:uncharacterized protein YyaL (SSP411 family)
MRNKAIYSSFFIFHFSLLLLAACTPSSKNDQAFFDDNIRFAAQQTEYMLSQVCTPDTFINPRTLNADGSVRGIGIYDWCSGFFAGTLWELYELTGDEKWRPIAERYTEALDRVQYYTDNHDVGFMMGDSYGQGRRILAGDKGFGYGPQGDDAYKTVLINTARSLCKRYVPEAGVIRSWGRIGGKQVSVIIDNMMNLELLFEASRLSGDDSFRQIAITHADNTLKNHFRPNGSCYHVLEYDAATGRVLSKHTNQGFADESAWSRGQSWAVYGFTLMYRYTRDKKYLDQALRTFAFLRDHPDRTDDLVPWWDMDAPAGTGSRTEERDASSAAVLSSALYELATYVSPRQRKELRAYADGLLTALASPAYRAEVGTNGGFLLMHSVGSKPHHAEVNVPLNYADYYFLEALTRKMRL